MTVTLAALLLLLPLALPARADQAIAAFKSAVPKMPERDRDGAQALITQLERLIKDGRASGMDECAIWQEIARRVSSS